MPPYYEHGAFRSRRPVRPPLANQVADLHHHRRLIAGPGDWRQYRHLHVDRSGSAAPLAGEDIPNNWSNFGAAEITTDRITDRISCPTPCTRIFAITTLSSAACFAVGATLLTSASEAKPTASKANWYRARIFPVLGVGAALGRVFTPDDDRIPDGHPIAVLSYQYWIERFGGDPSVLGVKLLVNGFPMTVVGVSQAGFNGMDPLYSPQIRIPMMMKRQLDPTSYKIRWLHS